MTVYFIACNSRIKIGYTGRMRDRMGQYRSQFGAVEIIGQVPGDIARERAVHRSLASYAEKGEWYFDTAELRSKIAEFLAKEPPVVVEIVPPPPEEYGPFPDAAERVRIDKRNQERDLAPLRLQRAFMQSHRADLIGLPREMFRMADEANELLEARYKLGLIELAADEHSNSFDHIEDMREQIAQVQMLITNIIICSQEQARRDAA